MRREFALADYQREKLIYTQDRLLELPTPDHRDGAAGPRAVLRDDQQVPATGSRE